MSIQTILGLSTLVVGCHVCNVVDYKLYHQRYNNTQGRESLKNK